MSAGDLWLLVTVASLVLLAGASSAADAALGSAPIASARAEVLAAGITINALPILRPEDGRRAGANLEAEYAERIIAMQGGRIIREGLPEELSGERIQEIYGRGDHRGEENDRLERASGFHMAWQQRIQGHPVPGG